MRIKPNFKRSESLRIKVLKKAVNNKESRKQKNAFSLEKAREMIANLKRQRNYDDEDEITSEFIPSAPKKIRLDKFDKRTKISMLNFNKLAVNFAKKFGVERKIITPLITPKKSEQGRSSPTGMKSGKGGKFIYI